MVLDASTEFDILTLSTNSTKSLLCVTDDCQCQVNSNLKTNRYHDDIQTKLKVYCCWQPILKQCPFLQQKTNDQSTDLY
jgi:hypothetical protein